MVDGLIIISVALHRLNAAVHCAGSMSYCCISVPTECTYIVYTLAKKFINSSNHLHLQVGAVH